MGKLVVINHLDTIPEDKRDPEFLDKITNDPDEMAAVLNFAIDGLKMLYEDRGFDSGIETDRMNSVRELIERKTNTLNAFVNEMIDHEPNCFIAKTLFYDIYKKYCAIYDIVPLQENIVGRKISETISAERKSVDEKRINTWKGVRFKDDITEKNDFELISTDINSLQIEKGSKLSCLILKQQTLEEQP